jgi:C1A family cysteine protease
VARRVARFGWVPDLPDQRDHMYAAPQPVLEKLPVKTDLRRGCPAVYDQGQLGSCTANAIAGAIQFDQKKEKLAPTMPSRLFIYYNERAMEGTISSDSGAMIRDGVKTIHHDGACAEKLWPYEPQKFTDKPATACYTAAKEHTAIEYKRLMPTLMQLKGCLADGYPFVFGFTVYASFESDEVARTGEANTPLSNEEAIGGHAVLAVGYDDRTQRFLVRNSWGPKWGMKGYFTLPYAYVSDPGLAADFWTIRTVK